MMVCLLQTLIGVLTMKHSTRFRELLAQKELLIATAAYDALSAKIIEQAGFKLMASTRSRGYQPYA